jgi:hypothetical protein
VLSEADCAAAVETAIGGSLQEPAVLEFEARYAADNPDLPHVLAGLPDLAPWSPGFPGPVLLLEQVARDMLRHEEGGLMIELPGLLSRIVLPPGRALPEGDGALDLVLAWRGGGLGTFTSRLLDVRLSPLWEGG